MHLNTEQAQAWAAFRLRTLRRATSIEQLNELLQYARRDLGMAHTLGLLSSNEGQQLDQEALSVYQARHNRLLHRQPVQAMLDVSDLRCWSEEQAASVQRFLCNSFTQDLPTWLKQAFEDLLQLIEQARQAPNAFDVAEEKVEHPDLVVADEEQEDHPIPDRDLTAVELDDKYNPEWDGEHPAYPRAAWRHEVINRNTISGYWDWVVYQLEQE